MWHHSGGGIDRESAREDGKTAQQASLCVREQIMAPIQGRAQCSMPRKRGATSGSQDREPISQAGSHQFNPENPGTNRSEFDGEWYTVETSTDRGNRHKVINTRGESRVQRFRSGDEQLHGAVVEYEVGCCLSGRGHVERRNAINGLSINA